jgi:hypothetical protein
MTISNIKFDIKPQNRTDNIRAFVDIIFQTDVTEMKVKMGTIRQKQFGEKSVLSFDSPAVRTKGGYQKVFIIENKEVFKSLCDQVMLEYRRMTGEVADYQPAMEQVDDLDDLPF